MDGNAERSSRIPQHIFGVGDAIKSPMLAAAVEHLFGLSELEAIYRRISRGQTAHQFVEAALADLNLSVEHRAEDLERIPKDGPLIVVANHPFGGVEGLLLARLLSRRRPDVRIVASYLLERIVELRDLFIFVDPWATSARRGRNARALLAALRHVRNGGALAVFPAGEVAHYDATENAIVESAWHPSIGRMIQAAKAPVVPVFFNGANRASFHLAGLLHPSLRTALLPNELLTKRDRRIEARIGRALSRRALPKLEPAALSAYLRDWTQALSFRRTGKPRGAGAPRDLEPIAPALPAELIATDIDKLTDAHALVTHGLLRVVWVHAAEIPNALLELGRLRELTFRAIGEGTGRSRDLDRFDTTYRHLILWNDAAREIVGAYRVGLVDELMAKGGTSELYSSTLFDLHPSFFSRVGPSLDLGRSFVRPEQQGSPIALALLWKGLGRIATLHPRYRHLFGPCSISDTYSSLSSDLIVAFLEREHSTDLRHLVRARVPHRKHRRLLGRAPSSRLGTWIRDPRDLSSWVSHIEPDAKGVPMLLQHYVRVGGKLLGFNVDSTFSCVDGLVLVDLLDTPRRTLDQFMGKERAAAFLTHHARG